MRTNDGRTTFRRRLAARLRRRPDDGATLVIGALLMVVLVGFVGFAVDVGMVYNERRQEQAAVDTAVLSGAREALLNGGGDQEVFDAVTELSHTNMDDPPPLAQWQADFVACTDPDAAGEGFTQPLFVGGNVIRCITFNADRSELRVKLPTTDLDTTFSTLLGFDRWNVSAFAEAGLAAGRGSPNILPFALSNGPSGSSIACLKTPPNGLAADDCKDGSTSGNFGYLAMPRPSWSENQRCNGGFGGTIINNIAQGIDHELDERTSNDNGASFTNPRVDDVCAQVEIGNEPNHVFTETGNSSQFLADGLVNGSSYIDDGLGGRLTRTTWETQSWTYGTAVDDRPLWEFFDPTLDYDGTDAPVICEPSYIANAPSLYGVTAAQSYGLAVKACLQAYDAGSYDTDLFDRDANGNGVNDILETPRFTWLPESWEDLSGCTGNCEYNIKQFRPVFVQNLYYVQSAKKAWALPPGPGNLAYGNSATPSNAASLSGASAFVLSKELFPQEILDEGPSAGRFDLVEIALTR